MSSSPRGNRGPQRLRNIFKDSINWFLNWDVNSNPCLLVELFFLLFCTGSLYLEYNEYSEEEEQRGKVTLLHIRIYHKEAIIKMVHVRE